MTFEQDLNVWCAKMEARLGCVEVALAGAQTTQRIVISLLIANMALLGIVIAALFRL